ncbi:MAG: hypothetical protein D6798_13325, partial [Deltaproteobacteria bacterium]
MDAVLTFALLVLGCAPVEPAPGAWSPPRCDASGLPDGGAEFSGRRGRTRVEMDDGVRLLALHRTPRGLDCTPAVVLVPPGLEGGQRLVDKGEADGLVARGVAVFSFDPRGRGASEGEEDVNGFRGQDDLAAILRWISARPDVDSSRIVVSSRSFGGALAAGALGRHADLAVAGWVDVESPGYLQEDLDYAAEETRERMFGLVDPDDPEQWWAEREPAGLVGGVTVPYHRFQGLPDHALGPRTLHAAAMLENAVQASALYYNGAAVDRDEISAGFVRDHALDGALDPDDPIVVDAVT